MQKARHPQSCSCDCERELDPADVDTALLRVSDLPALMTVLCISKASSAHSLSESLQDLLDIHATSAELRALHHEGVQRFFSIGAYISYSLEVDDKFTAGNVICMVLACDLSQLVGPRRNDLTL